MSDVNDCYYTERALASPALPFLQLYDAGRVSRFHTSPDYSGVPRQNLAEHSWGVAMIALELCRRSKVLPSSELLQATLTHDLSEYWTTDMPAHIKWRNPELAQKLDAEQERVERGRGINGELTPFDSRVLWWSDKLELFLYSTHRARAGASSYYGVATNIERHIRANKEDNATHYFLNIAGRVLLDELKEALA